MAAAGLSPRVRGSLSTQYQCRLLSSRVYPRVCGGALIVLPVHKGSALRVYPRVCGGARYAHGYRNLDLNKGLSPRVRGSHLDLPPLDEDGLRVYPRVCGGANGAAGGSGKPPYCGSIPACAGEPS